MSHSDIWEKIEYGQNHGLTFIIISVMLIAAGAAYGIERIIRNQSNLNEHPRTKSHRSSPVEDFGPTPPKELGVNSISKPPVQSNVEDDDTFSK